jgi:hypothetical protein
LALALTGLGFPSADAPLVLNAGEENREWLPTAVANPNRQRQLSPSQNSQTVRTDGDTVCATPKTEAGKLDWLMIAGPEMDAGQKVMVQLDGTSLPLSHTIAPEAALTVAGASSWLDAAMPLSQVVKAGSDGSAKRLPLMFAAPALFFDASTGQLAVRAGFGEHTVREALVANGFVDLTLDGQHHSSDARSAAFDSGLAGATSTTVTGIRFDGQGTLTLDTRRSAGGWTVQAAGATVVTEDVATSGPLVIQASNIAVSGSLRGSNVALVASGWVTVDAAGRVDAASTGRGGRVSPLLSPPTTIAVSAGIFANSGQLHANGPSGGQINVQAGSVLNAGPMTADASSVGGNGGQVHIAFTDSYVGTTAAVVSASSSAGAGGSVTIDGGGAGHLYNSGRQMATGSIGGAVDLFAKDVILSGASVDVSGEAGGGSVHISTEAQRNLVARNATTVTVTPASTIRADAVHTGDGGRVSVWANQTTVFNGAVSARGGPAGGSGGVIDLSGPGNLSYGGSADASARWGNSGMLLLDPKNITISDAPLGVFPQFDLLDPHPTTGGYFGAQVSVLASGNVVVTNPTDDFGGAGAGAAYLFDGLSGALISALVGTNPGDGQGGMGIYGLSNGNYLVRTWGWNGNRGAVTWGSGVSGVSGPISDVNSLVGSNPGDHVGTITALNNGNYVVTSFYGGRGAATWGNGDAGTSGIVSDANSIVGSNSGDSVGNQGVVPLGNGNYVIDSPNWNGYLGAVTWGNGSTGSSGIVSDSNSLVGNNGYDRVGPSGISLLTNGNYVVNSASWNGNRGAVTWGNGTTGVRGVVSETNSLVGTNSGDLAGYIVALRNGNYLVVDEGWNGDRGAVAWGSGSTGIAGAISEANSVVGGNAKDAVGNYGVILLSNGNYVVRTLGWNGGRGAVTWGDSSTGVRGIVSAENSIVGSNPGDGVGGVWVVISIRPPVVQEVGDILPLSNGNYLVESPLWNNRRGAVTWGNGSTGTSGTVSDANSLVGNPGDQVGYYGVTPASNGNYIVDIPGWNENRGAVTWADGSIGVSGIVSDANSLVGVNPGDVSWAGQLSNGNFVLDSPSWNANRGAVTWISGANGLKGTFSSANSLAGSNPGDAVGSRGVAFLSNGNYVVGSPNWNGAGRMPVATGRGAVTWGDGSIGVSGIVSEANSLIGTNPTDQVGYDGVVPLANGNYLIRSPYWNGSFGALTWANGSTGITGSVSDANSLVGSNPYDHVGAFVYSSLTLLSNGNYVVFTPDWNSQSGAVTWGSGSMGVRGILSDANSLLGSNPGDLSRTSALSLLSNGNYLVTRNGAGGAVAWVSGATGQTLDGLGAFTPQNALVGVRNAVEDPIHRSFLAVGNGRVTVGVPDPNQFSYARSQALTLTFTPAFLTHTLDTGTAVILQASNDITLDAPIVVSAGGQGGTLTLQAGRSLLLNASVITDGGALNLIANDPLANGVVDSQRDPGKAVITMAPGTALDTGSGSLTVELRDGAGLSNRNSGAITLQAVLAGSVSVVNNGPSAQSDVWLGPVTSSGSQNYANANGTTVVTGNLTATDNAITFNDSVALNAGITLDAGSSTINFVSGTVAPSAGVVTLASGAVFNGSATFSVALNGTDPGSYSQVVAGGPIILYGSTLSLVLGFEPPVGSSFEILTNTGSTPISGTFNGLSEGAVFAQGGYEFQITYTGGTGGDSVVLTRLT